MNQEIRLDQPELFTHEPSGGVPSSPITVRIETREGTLEAATIGEPAVDDFAATLAEDSVVGARWLKLDSSRGIETGRRYVVGEAPATETVIVTTIQGPRVLLRQPMIHSFTAASPLRGCQVSIGVDPTWQRGLSRQVGLGGVGIDALRAKWSYMLHGTIRQAVEHVDLVFVSRASVVTPEDVERRYPGWLGNENTTSRAIELIAEAHDLVQRDAARANIGLNNMTEARELIELRARITSMEQMILYGRTRKADLDAAELQYRRRATELWSKLDRASPTETPRVAPIEEQARSLTELRAWLDKSKGSLSEWSQLNELRRRWLARLGELDRSERGDAAKMIRGCISSVRLRPYREEVIRELIEGPDA
jgi:hypothetical protein